MALRLRHRTGHDDLTSFVDDCLGWRFPWWRHHQLGFLGHVQPMSNTLLAWSSGLGALLEQVHRPATGFYTNVGVSGDLLEMKGIACNCCCHSELTKGSLGPLEW